MGRNDRYYQQLAKIGGLLLLPLASQLVACQADCDGAFVGSSSLAPLIAQDWPYGSGTANGAWRVTLTPNSFGTSCVVLTDGEYPPENYTYSLEFSGASASEDPLKPELSLYVEGVVFATGIYTDESAEIDTPDLLTYRSGTRVTADREGGAITWEVEGSGQLEANRRAGSLVWSGFEEIRVIQSEDPLIRPGCTFSYDVTGFKVCDE